MNCRVSAQIANPARERTVPFARMTAVTVEIPEIVGDIGRRRTHGQRSKRQRQRRDPVHVEECERGQQRHEQQQVLQPLMHTQRPAPRRQIGLLLREFAFDVDDFTHGCRHGRRHTHQNRALRRRPDRQVGPAVARIDEVLAHAGTDAGQLCRPLEVDVLPGRDYCIEHAEMRAHAFGNRTVRGGGENDRAALFSLCFQIVEQGLPIRNAVRLKISPLGYPGLEGGTSGGKPEWQTKQIGRIAPDGPDDGFRERIGRGQRAVQIDDER